MQDTQTPGSQVWWLSGCHRAPRAGVKVQSWRGQAQHTCPQSLFLHHQQQKGCKTGTPCRQLRTQGLLSNMLHPTSPTATVLPSDQQLTPPKATELQYTCPWPSMATYLLRRKCETDTCDSDNGTALLRPTGVHGNSAGTRCLPGQMLAGTLLSAVLSTMTTPTPQMPRNTGGWPHPLLLGAREMKKKAVTLSVKKQGTTQSWQAGKDHSVCPWACGVSPGGGKRTDHRGGQQQHS